MLPKPYYYDEQYGIKIFLGDCRTILPHLDPVDAVITDWPYGVGVDYETYIDSDKNLDELISTCFPALLTVSKRVCFTCGVLNQWKYPKPTWGLCLFSPNSNGSGPWGFTCWQPVLCYGKDPYLQNNKGRQPDARSFSGMAKPESKHPCPKPLKLWSWVVNRCSMPGETIIDPFMGLGTTLITAKNLGRKAIGIEIEQKYCDIAIERLRQGVLEF